VCDALCLVELRGFEPLTSCMPSQRTWQMGQHHSMRDRTRPQVGNAVPCGLVRRHAASLPGNRRGAPPARWPMPYARHHHGDPFSARVLAGRPLRSPGATPACAPTEPSERGGRSSGRLSETTTTTPIVGVSPAAPTPRPASLARAVPSRPGDKPHWSCPRIQARSDRHHGDSAQSHKWRPGLLALGDTQ
jgi:hypothetical protein